MRGASNEAESFGISIFSTPELAKEALQIRNKWVQGVKVFLPKPAIVEDQPRTGFYCLDPSTPSSIKSNKHREYRHWATRLQREGIAVMRLSSNFVIGGTHGRLGSRGPPSMFLFFETCICLDCAHESGENRIVARTSRQVRYGHSTQISFHRCLSLSRQRCSVEAFGDHNHTVATTDPRMLPLWWKIGGMAS